MRRGRPNRIIFEAIAKYAHNRKTLDIGCGNKAYSHVSINTTTLDGWDAVSPDFLINLENEDLPFENNEFECVLMIDLIEHLTRKRGEQILEQAKQIASGRIYLLTPLWWDTNENHTSDPKCWAYGNELNLHRSLWKREDFLDWTEIRPRIQGGKYYFGYWKNKCNSQI